MRVTYGWMDGHLKLRQIHLGIKFKNLAHCQRAVLYDAVSVVKDKVEQAHFFLNYSRGLIKIRRGRRRGGTVQFIARPGLSTPSRQLRTTCHQQTSSPPFIGEIINYSAKVHLNWKGFKSDHFVVETTLAESGQFLSNRLNIKTGFMMWTKLFTWTWYLLYTSIKRGFRNIVWEEHIYKCRSVFWALLK